MKSVATMKVKLLHREELFETMRQYSKSAQIVADAGWELHSSDKRELHDLTYRHIRKVTILPAQLVCSSRDVACDNLKAVFRKDGSKPTFRQFLAIRYDHRSFSIKNDVVSLCTVNGRIKIPVNIPAYFSKYADWKVCSANLIFDRKRRLFLHIVVSKDVSADSVSCGNGKCVGIDVGINNIAVTSERQFFNATFVKRKKLHYRRLRAKLQAKGTRASRRLLKRISGKEKMFMAWVNHNISNTIVNGFDSGDVVVMEKLKGIRNQRKGRRFNYWLSNWSFYQLQRFIEYKAVRKGCRVVYVKPTNTSKTCSKCGSLHTSRTKSFFKCLHCGYTLNADLNASMNLAKSHSIPDAISAAVNQPNLTH